MGGQTHTRFHHVGLLPCPSRICSSSLTHLWLRMGGQGRTWEDRRALSMVMPAVATRLACETATEL